MSYNDSYLISKQKLVATIDSWKEFEELSLPKLWHTQLDPYEWESRKQGIELGVKELQNKVERIRRRVKEVKDLREGVSILIYCFSSKLTRIACLVFGVV